MLANSTQQAASRAITQPRDLSNTARDSRLSDKRRCTDRAKPLSDPVPNHGKLDRIPPRLIEAEMERVLAEEHGFDGVRVRLSHAGPRVTCDPDVPDAIKGRAFAAAVKRAVIKFVRGERDP